MNDANKKFHYGPRGFFFVTFSLCKRAFHLCWTTILNDALDLLPEKVKSCVMNELSCISKLVSFLKGTSLSVHCNRNDMIISCHITVWSLSFFMLRVTASEAISELRLLGISNVSQLIERPQCYHL